MLRNFALSILLLSVLLPLGCRRAFQVDTKELSLAIYPGAIPKGSRVLASEFGTRFAFDFTTSDSFDLVADFYKRTYPYGKVSDITMPGCRLLNIEMVPPNNRGFVVIRQPSGARNVTIILIEQK